MSDSAAKIPRPVLTYALSILGTVLFSILSYASASVAEKVDGLSDRVARLEENYKAIGSQLSRIEAKVDKLEDKVDKLSEK